MKKGSLIILFIAFILIGLLIFFMPDIYNKFQEFNTPKVNVTETKEDVEKIEPITMDSDVIKNLTMPIMHNDKYSKESYYQKDVMNINDFSNNDILYNAFLDIYEGYLVDYKSFGCATAGKKFDATYLKSRIKNIIGKNINYSFEDFTVPNINKDTNYIGLWKYNISDNSYVFYGDCSKNNNDIIYDDIKELYKVDSSKDNNIIYLYYHIGFVKKDVNKYYIYKDVNYSEEVENGDLISINSNINVDLSKFKTYKYTFKKGLCSYDNYCFYKGEWVND